MVLGFVRTMSTVPMAARQIAVFGVSFLIASLFYKFGSFALETVAFLATWFALDVVAELGQRLAGGGPPARTDSEPG